MERCGYNDPMSPDQSRRFQQAEQLLRGGRPIAAHIAQLTGRDAPFKVVRSWSVRLAPGGAHVDHLHKAWISSAFYVALPAEVEAGGRAGWLRLGKPGLITTPPLEAERWIQPRPGMLALFPSSMWHGTEAFGDGAERLTIAFDVDPTWGCGALSDAVRRSSSFSQVCPPAP